MSIVSHSFYRGKTGKCFVHCVRTFTIGPSVDKCLFRFTKPNISASGTLEPKTLVVTNNTEKKLDECKISQFRGLEIIGKSYCPRPGKSNL